MIPISTLVKNIPGRTSSAQYEILFRASVPALGFNTYYFQKQSKEQRYFPYDLFSLANATLEKKPTRRVTHNEACILQNQVIIQHQYDIDCFSFFLFAKHLKVEFDEQGNLNKMTNRDQNLAISFSTQGLYWYTSRYLQ